MAIPDGLNDREHRKFRESIATPGQPAVAIVNPDGTNIGGSGGTSMTDGTAYVQGASSLTPAGFLGDDTPNALGADERIGVARMRRSTRVQFAELVDSSGNPVSVGGGTQYAEDSAHVSGDQVTLAGVVRRDADTGLSDLDGDRTLLVVNGSQFLKVTVKETIGLTDVQLRASAVPVSGPLTDAQLRATAVPVSGALTDTQLRASAVPVSGPLTDAQLRASAIPVSGPLTDTQLRASPVPVDTDVRTRTTDHIGAAGMTDALMSGLTALTPKFALIDFATSGDHTIVAAVAGKKIRVLRYSLVVGAAVNVTWASGAGVTTKLTGQMNFAANGGIAESYCPLGLFETASGALLNLNTLAAVQVGGSITYVEV